MSFENAIETVTYSYLGTYYRPYNTPPSVLTTLHVSITGNDTTGDGSIGSPFLTIGRAVQAIGTNNSGDYTIQLDEVASFDLPAPMTGANFITIQGSEETEEIRNVSGVTVTSRTGVVFTVDGATLSDDEWQDRHLQLLDNYSNNRNIMVKRNVGNVIYGVMYTRSVVSDLQSNFTTGRVGLLNYSEVINNTGARTIFQDCNSLRFYGVKYTSPNDNTNFRGGNMVIFWKCQIDGRQFGQIGGTVWVLSCSLANVGSTGPVVGLGYNSIFLFGASTVVSDRNIVGAQNYINCFYGGRVIIDGLVFFRGAYGFSFNGGFLEIAAAGNTGYTIFDNDTGTPTCPRAFRINGQSRTNGQYYYTPICKGAVTEDHFLRAKLGARVVIPSGTSVITNTEVNAVSADDGASSISMAPDGTVIRGGYPEFVHDYSAVTTIDEGDTPYSVDLSVTKSLRVKTDVSAIAVNLPSLSDVTLGGGIWIEDIQYNAGTNKITINPDGSDKVDNDTVLEITANGGSVYLEADHVNNNWIIS